MRLRGHIWWMSYWCREHDYNHWAYVSVVDIFIYKQIVDSSPHHHLIHVYATTLGKDTVEDTKIQCWIQETWQWCSVKKSQICQRKKSLNYRVFKISHFQMHAKLSVFLHIKDEIEYYYCVCGWSLRGKVRAEYTNISSVCTPDTITPAHL